MAGTGFVEQPWLLRSDTGFVQLTELLYRIAEHLDGTRSPEDVAASVTETTRWSITGDQVRWLIDTKLAPLRLVAVRDSVQRSRASHRSPLQIRARWTLVGAERLAGIADVLRVLYAPALIVPLLLLSTGALTWVHLVHGGLASVKVALYTPGAALVGVTLSILAAFVHELGHAAGLAYGGGRVGRMGMAFYLVYPTFYTDISDAYRLGRWARLRADLGGIYFHLLSVLVLVAVYLFVREEVLIAVVVVITADILYQALPYARLDGYWVLADLTGIPDFFSNMAPFVRRLFGARTVGGTRLPPLKRWVSVVFVVYIVVCIPLLAIALFLLVAGVPRFLHLATDAALQQIRLLEEARLASDAVSMAAIVSQLGLLALSAGATTLLLVNAGASMFRALQSWSRPTRARRVMAAVAFAAIAASVVVLWLPMLNTQRAPVPPGVRSFIVSERAHVKGTVTYPQHPPVGGRHAAVPQNCGFYSHPIPNEHAVHSLEHGAVWITYRPDLNADAISVLKDVARSHTHILVSPMAELPSPVVATAWAHQLLLQSVDDPRLGEFVRAFRLARSAPESGASCTEGVGVPAK